MLYCFPTTACVPILAVSWHPSESESLTRQGHETTRVISSHALSAFHALSRCRRENGSQTAVSMPHFRL